MIWKKILDNLRVFSGATGGQVKTTLPVEKWGLSVKDVIYVIVVTDRSGANAKVGILHSEGPEENTTYFETHTTAISPVAPAAIPDMLRGQTNSGANGPLMPFFAPVLLTESTDANQSSVVVTVWCGGKAF